MATQIQLRRGTAASATSANPTLAPGEVGFETDTGFYKIGDGSTAWTSLPYAGGPMSAFFVSLLNDANAAAVLTTLGGTAAGQALFTAATAAAQRTALLVDPAAVIRSIASAVPQTFDSTTVASITGLVLALPAAGAYEIEATIGYEAADAAVGPKLGATLSNNDGSRFHVAFTNQDIPASENHLNAGGTVEWDSANDGGDMNVCEVSGIVRVDAAGTLQFQFGRHTDTGDHDIIVVAAVARARLIG